MNETRAQVVTLVWGVLLVMVLLAAGAAPGEPINLRPDVVYKTTPQGELCLDLYYPETELSGKYPVVIYTHGGGWAAGSIMIVKNAGHNWRKADGVTPIEPGHTEIIKRTVDFLGNLRLKTEN